MTTDDKDARARTTKRIAEVRTRFSEGLGERTAGLADLARAGADPDHKVAANALDGLRLGLHNLAGAAPTLGMLDLGRRAAALEARVMTGRAAGGLARDEAEALARDIAALADEGG